MAILIDGPRLTPKRPAAEELVVFLHGYGANGNDLIAIGKEWQELLPGAAFAAPHAPEPCAQVPGGRQWFPLTMRDPEERWIGVNKAYPALEAFLAAELVRHRLDASRLALVGFSQGAMLALHAGLRLRDPPCAIVGYSGLLCAPGNPGEALPQGHAGKKPAILLIHGSDDDLIPAEALFRSVEMLAEAGFPCEWHLSGGLGHGIDAEGLLHGGLFLAKRFGCRPERGAWPARP